MTIRDELIEELPAGKDPQKVFSSDGRLDGLKRALAERILNTEMDQHLAAERAEEAAGDPRNHRNGHSRKTVLTGTGKLDLQVPRDRQASFEPQLIAKYRRRFQDFDDKIVSLYAATRPSMRQARTQRLAVETVTLNRLAAASRDKPPATTAIRRSRRSWDNAWVVHASLRSSTYDESQAPQQGKLH